jgi:hypothetical protein
VAIDLSLTKILAIVLTVLVGVAMAALNRRSGTATRGDLWTTACLVATVLLRPDVAGIVIGVLLFGLSLVYSIRENQGSSRSERTRALRRRRSLQKA